MKKAILMLITFIGSILFAAESSYKLKIKFSPENGKEEPFQIMVQEGKKASYSKKTGSEEFFIEVVATNKNEQEMLMTFAVGTITKNNEKRVLGNPQITVAKNNFTEKTISVGDEKRKISLAIYAEREKHFQ